MTVLLPLETDMDVPQPLKIRLGPSERQISEASTKCCSDDGSASETGDVARLFTEPIVPRLLAGHGLLTRLAIRMVQPTLYFGCIALTRMVLGARSFFALFLRGSLTRPELHRPTARLTYQALATAKDPVAHARAALPVPPPFPAPPPDGLQVSFGPCANLMIWNGGVAACLQNCPNYAEVFPQLRFYGVSCGAFVASTMAANEPMLNHLPMLLAWTEKFQGRLWGLIGAYSESISAIVRGMLLKPGAFENARNRLGIPVTAFLPMPQRVRVENFSTVEDLIGTLLGSCYIPVAFETPQWSASLGPLWDGAIFEFAAQGDIVASPYANTLPDIMPERPYPAHFSFFPPHGDDVVRIFEDGYMDCLRWLEAGCPTRAAAREAAFGNEEGGLGPMLREAKCFLKRIMWGESLAQARLEAVALCTTGSSLNSGRDDL